MEILTAIACLLQIANMIFNLRDRLELTKEQKQALSELLNNIGSLINHVSLDLEKNIYPRDKCLQMEIYANELKNILNKKMKDDDIDKLSKLLDESIKVERLLGELNNLSFENRDKNLELLRMASSSFVTSGEIIKIR